MDSHRAEARSTIVTLADMLGPYYFDFILEELCSALRRGYQLHILGYTIHSILQRMLPKFEPG